MPGAVSDSSTLIHLARIGRLHLLKEFHNKIFISPAVWREVVEEGQGKPGSEEAQEGYHTGWIEVSAPKNQQLIHFLRKELHDGESETIALALDLNADIVFLDESEARTAAGIFGLKISGVIGILIRAKNENKISSLKDELEKLKVNAGFWIGDELLIKVLRASGEDSD